jgi:hypothetical protein
MPLCGAKKKSGELCRAFAGQGTDHPGVGKCKFHLGNSPTHQVSAVVQETQRRMIKLGMPIEVHPHEALLSMLYLASGHVAWLRAEIGATDDLGTFEARVLVELYGTERDRVAKVAKAALDAGVNERQVALAERYGEQLADFITTVFADDELGLTAGQREQLPAVLRRHLVTLGRGRELAA